MNLKYRITYSYDYGTNSTIITLHSPYFQKDYPVTNLQNLTAALGHAILDFNETHKLKIEELEEDEKVKKYLEKKSGSKKPEGE